MPSPAASPKETLREEIKGQLRKVSGEEFRLQGAKAAALLSSSPIWSRHEHLFLFLSMKSEIDTQPLLETALRQGKKVFAPRVEARSLVFCRMLSLEWRKGPFGLREPPLSAAEEKAGFPALILAPGLAFDREGNRLGRGGGYYDRFFAELDECRGEYLALGLCMDFQLVGRVPAEGHDKKVGGVLTGAGLFVVPPRKLA